MKIRINFIDSVIDFENGNIYSFEIHNKKYLYRISSLFHSISCGEFSDEFECYDENNNEVKLNNRIRFFTDYFEFNFDSKKYTNDITKYLISVMEQNDNENILKAYFKLSKLINKELSKCELPILVSPEEDIESIIKLFKLKVQQKSELLDNLFLIIDLEVILNSNKILCFVNLKQYLSREELAEFFKYSTYNSVKIIMIESTKYDYVSDYEKIIIIDEELDESMI